MSSHNPNVFLELGWALRADKPYVLIKDDLTAYNFDLSTHAQFSYCHMLQPTMLRKKVAELKNTISQTITDQERRYSLTKQLAVSSKAIKEAEAGDINTQLLIDVKQNLDELRKERALEQSKEDDERRERSAPLMFKDILAKSQPEESSLLKYMRSIAEREENSRKAVIKFGN